MKITVFGTRGSYTVCRHSFMRYGGNTTCLYLESGKDRIVIDGGSGVAPLGRQLVESGQAGELNLFLTHPHWDHVMGLPFFLPLYTPGFEVSLYGSDSDNKTLQGVFSTQHAEEHFPVRFSSLSRQVQTKQLASRSEVQLGSTRIKAFQLNHPGMNLGYRFEGDGGTFVILTDLAPIRDNHLGHGIAQLPSPTPVPSSRTTMVIWSSSRCRPRFLRHQFPDEEIQGRLHWGHSTPQHALETLAELSDGPALILSHHDPNHSDEFMDLVYERTRAAGRAQNTEVLIAREGEGFTL